MATNVNYTSLVGDVTRYIERGGSASSDPTVFDQIPRLINQAERNIMTALKLLGAVEVLVDGTGLTEGQPIVTKPDRWRQTVSISYGAGATNNTRTLLLPRSLEYCRNFWPDDSVTNADFPPQYYADYDLQHWLVCPTPPSTYPLEIIAYLQPMLLDETTQTNFFTIYTPSLLLYGALLEAAPFLKSDDRIPVWQTYWNQQVALLQTQDLQRILDRSTERKST